MLDKDEFDSMMDAIMVLSDIKKQNKVVVDKEQFDTLVQVNERVEVLLDALRDVAFVSLTSLLEQKKEGAWGEAASWIL